MGRPKTIKPRPYGTGTVDRLANGTYRGRVTIDGVRETVYHGTDPDECGRLLDDLLDGIRPDDPAPDGVTFKAWLDTWHDDYADADANTLDGYRNEIALLQPLHGHVVTDLEVKDFDRLLKALAKDGYAKSTLQHVRATAGKALDKYNDLQHLTFNPAERCGLPPDRHIREKDDYRSLTERQARDLLDAAQADRLAIVFVLGLNLALRPGEICGLKWSDIDLDGDVAQLAVQRFRRVTTARDKTGKGRQVMSMSKYAKARSNRPIALPANVVAALRRWKTEQTKERVKSARWADLDLVVTTTNGNPVDPSNIRRTVARVAHRAGIFDTADVPDLRPYELRHTCVTLLIERGRPLEEVADLCGNSVRTLEQNYRHRTRRLRADHVAHVEEMFG